MLLTGGGYLLDLDKEFSRYFNIISTTPFTKTMESRITQAVKLTVRHPEFNKKRPVLVVMISENGSIGLTFPDDAQGHQGNFAFIRYTAFTEYYEIGTLTILTEEFVHYFWDTHDEECTKILVCEILPNVRLNSSKTQYVFDKL